MRGAWIEISCVIVQPKTKASLPVRGAWIEIWYMDGQTYTAGSLPVRGAWIEILVVLVVVRSHARRSPCGERGLKFFSVFHSLFITSSLPVRGAWIEMHFFAIFQDFILVAPRAGSVD